jgi:hypothetical protein
VTADTKAVGGKVTTAQLRAVARDAYRASLAEGVPLPGAELGRRFGCPRVGAASASLRCTPRQAAGTDNAPHRGSRAK